MKPLLLLLPLIVLAIGCSTPESWRMTFLKTGQDHATQDEIKQQFGSPEAMQALAGGGSQWVYQFWSHESGDRLHAAGSWCDRYVLTFDEKTVLRHWVHDVNRHRGEPMPQQC
jgi:hypothetical protein